MKFITIRQIWHDAFCPDLSNIDLSDKTNHWGVQFSTPDHSQKIVDHVEKGRVQHAIAELKKKDKVAWAWGMIAYAPPSMGLTAEPWEIMREFYKRRIRKLDEQGLKRWQNACARARLANQPSPVQPALIADSWEGQKYQLLAKLAVLDVAHEDVTGQKRRRKFDALAAYLKCSGSLDELAAVYKGITEEDKSEYSERWHKYYCDARGKARRLPERCLPAVSDLIFTCLECVS